MSGIELVAILADSILALGTLAAVIFRGGQVLEQLRQAREEIERLRDWKHDEVTNNMNALERSLAVHDERLDQHDGELLELRRRVRR